MTTQLRDIRHPAGASMNSQRAKLIYQLFLLENARNTLERELIDFAKTVFKIQLQSSQNALKLYTSVNLASLTS